MSIKYKYEGEDISEDFVTEGFEQSSFTILDEYISNTDGLEVVEEEKEEDKKDFQNGAAGKDVPVVPVNPSRASIIAGVQPEVTESPSVDISSELEDPDPKKPLSASEKRIATRKRREQEKQDRLKAEAITATNEIETRIENIPKEDIVTIQANEYFGPIKTRSDRTTVSTTVPGAMGPTMSFEPTFDSDESYTKYLKETLGVKYDQYLDYKETNNIVPLSTQNESELNGLYNDAETKAKDKVYNNSLFNVSEDVQEYMVASPKFASGAESIESQEFLVKELEESLTKNIESYGTAKKEWESQALPLNKEIKDLKTQIDRFTFYSDGASQEQADQYNELIQTYNSKIQQWEEKGFNELPVFVNSQYKLVNSQQKDYSKMLEDSRRALIDSDLFEKNLKQDYSASARVGRVFDEFFVQSTRNFLDLTAELGLKGARAAGAAGFQPLAFLTSPENSAKVDSVIETIQKNNKNYNLSMASKRENIPTSPSIDDIGKDGLSVWDWTSISLQDNSATIATTFAPGLASLKGASGVKAAFKTASYTARKKALQNQKKLWLAGKRTVQGTFFVAETGGKYGELQTDEASREQEIKFLYSKLNNIEDIDERTEIYNKINELEEVEDYTLLQKAFTSYGAGTTATLLESLGTLKMLEPAKGLAKQIGVKAAKKELYKQPVRFGANLVGKTLAGLKSMPKNMSGEIAEEVLTEVSHNGLDILVLDENKSMFEGINKDFLASTGLSTIGIMAPRSAGNTFNIIKSEFRTKDEIFDNQKLARELIDLNESTTPENSKELRGRKRQLLKELALSDAISLHKLRYMTADQIEEVADINRQMRQVNGKFSQLGGLGDLGEAENKRVKKQLENEYSSLTTARQELLDAKQRSNTKKAANMNEALGNAAQNSNASFYYGVNDFYNDLVMTQMGDGDFISIKGKQEEGGIKYEDLDKQLAKYKGKMVKVIDDKTGKEVEVDAFEYLKENVENNSFNAAQLFGDIIVNQPFIDRKIASAPTGTGAQYAAISPLEELFHLSVAQKGIKFDSTAKNAVLEAENILKEKRDLGVISEEDYNGLNKRFDQYRGKDSKDFNAEEFIAQMNNAVSLGAINRSDLESAPSFKKFLNNTIRSTFGDMSWMLKLENSDDVFNLVKNFQSDVSKGVTFQAPERDELKTSLSEDIQNELEALEDSYFDGDIDEYQFEQRRDNLDIKLKQAEEAEKAEKAAVVKQVETEVVKDVDIESTKEVEEIDKIVKKATTKVFKSPEVSEKNKKIASVNEDIVKEITVLGANRISDIKDPDVKKAIIDKLGKNNIGAVTELAKKAAATSRNLPIDDNLKVGYEEFFLGFSEELSALINSYKANVDGKEVPFGAYMNQNLPIRYGSILERSLKGKLKGSESLSSDKNVSKQVAGIESDSNDFELGGKDDSSEELIIDQIDVRKFGPARDKVDEISKIVKVEKGERPSYKDLANKYLDQVSMELFNVPGKKIKGGATLKDSEAKSLQALFINPNNVRKLFKTMPPYNVAGSETTIGEQGETIGVSKDVKGKSIGLSNKFMIKFYQPVTRAIPGISSPKGRSLGLTSQGQVYELKPEFRGRITNEAIKDIQRSVGVTEKGVPSEKISDANRSKYGTTLTGFAKAYVANVINITGRSKQTDKQEQADTGAGKAKIMLSKGSDINENLTNNNDNYTRFRNSILNKDMFHGGSKTTSTEATWFYLDDPEAAKMWGDGKVYKTNSSLLTDQLIIPDLNDVSEYHKHASKKFGLPEENFFDVRNIMKLSNAGEIINDWIDWVTKNKTDWDLGYSLYEQGSLTEGIAVTVIGKTPESKLEPFKEDIVTGESRVMFSKDSALEEGVDPKTLLSTKVSKKTLSTKQVDKKSDIIFNDTKALFLNNIGDVDSFLNDTVDYLKNIKLKDKDLQNNIRRVATAPSTRGNLTEYYNWHKLNNNNTLKEALGIKKLIPKKWNSPNDIEAEFNDGTIEGIEVKMNWKDIMGSGGLFFDGKKVKSYTYNNGEPKVSDDIVDGINNNIEVINKLITATENASNVKSIVKDGKVGMPFTLLSETEGQARSSRKELNRPKFKDISMSIDQVLNHYKKKDVGLFIVGDELFYVQDKRGNFKEMGIPKLNTDASIKLRVKTSGIKFRKTAKDFVDSYTLTGQYQFSKKPENGLKFSKASDLKLNKEFNNILENKSGIPSRKKYGIVEAITKGASKGRFNFFIPPSAEDFVGLLYPTLGKGKVGDEQMAWYKANLIDPYAEAVNKLSKARVYLTNTYNQLKKQLGVVPKDLAKKIEGTDYTKEQAVRVYIWNKQKMDIPGISKRDVNKLNKFVADDANLQTFADQLINMQLGDGYAKPKEGWPAGTITTDILEGLNTTKRAKYLKTWQSNVDAIFSEENLNKLQAVYGLNYRKALENMLKRMKTGRNRNFSGDSMTGRFTDWLTGSIGAIMFFNTRSAVLQTISAINFINFKDNNIFAAAKAFANQKQYWADFMTLMNSDFLKERRGGLRINVNEADIADMAKKGGVRGAISKLLELGFLPTQIADSFAIASGGSTFYRNRIDTYKKQGLTDKQAEKKAFEDFRETAEESQQSSRADRISMQQASPLGRTVLAFANTPAQYARIIKKAASDLKNGRGDRKENISKIIYYGVAQNLIFNALQQALFALAFSDEEPEDEKKEEKYLNIANGMLDSILRGTGIGGAIVTVGKNTLIKMAKELKKDRPQLKNIALEVAKISPPVSAKLSRLQQAGRSYDWNKEEMRTKGLSLENPAFLAGANVVTAFTNIPLDRAIKKANNVVSATSQDLETWERISLLGGWQDWELGIDKKLDKENKPKSDTIVRKSGVTRKKVIRK